LARRHWHRCDRPGRRHRPCCCCFHLRSHRQRCRHLHRCPHRRCHPLWCRRLRRQRRRSYPRLHCRCCCSYWRSHRRSRPRYQYRRLQRRPCHPGTRRRRCGCRQRPPWTPDPTQTRSSGCATTSAGVGQVLLAGGDSASGSFVIRRRRRAGSNRRGRCDRLQRGSGRIERQCNKPDRALCGRGIGRNGRLDHDNRNELERLQHWRGWWHIRRRRRGRRIGRATRRRRTASRDLGRRSLRLATAHRGWPGVLSLLRTVRSRPAGRRGCSVGRPRAEPWPARPGSQRTPGHQIPAAACRIERCGSGRAEPCAPAEGHPES
jgi:hypothetical protein